MKPFRIERTARGKNKMTEFLIYLLILILISMLNFYLYASDKMRAKNGLYRIPEAVLLSVSFFWRCNRRAVRDEALSPQD